MTVAVEVELVALPRLLRRLRRRLEPREPEPPFVALLDGVEPVMVTACLERVAVWQRGEDTWADRWVGTFDRFQVAADVPTREVVDQDLRRLFISQQAGSRLSVHLKGSLNPRRHAALQRERMGRMLKLQAQAEAGDDEAQFILELEIEAEQERQERLGKARSRVQGAACS